MRASLASSRCCRPLFQATSVGCLAVPAALAAPAPAGSHAKAVDRRRSRASALGSESVKSLRLGGDQARHAGHERQVLQFTTTGTGAFPQLDQSGRERAHQHRVGLIRQIRKLVRILRQVVELPLAAPVLDIDQLPRADAIEDGRLVELFGRRPLYLDCLTNCSSVSVRRLARREWVDRDGAQIRRPRRSSVRWPRPTGAGRRSD